jgi:replicative DNA helicase
MQNTINFKTLPHSIEAEQALLGVLIINENRIVSIIDYLHEVHFYVKEHQVIYHHIVKLNIAYKNIDVVTLANELNIHNQLEYIGGAEYLDNLARSVLPSANIENYAQIIKDNYVLRELINVGNNIIDSAYTTLGKSLDVLLDEAEQKVFQIKNHSSNQDKFKEFPDLLDEVVTNMQAVANTEDGVTGIPSFYYDLDQKTAGFQRGELIIVAGRPGMGKTSFALNLAENVAVEAKLPVAIFSLEMPAIALAQRILSSRARVSQNSIKRGALTPNDFDKIFDALDVLKEANIFIAESTGINVIDLRAKARRMAHKYGKLGLIVIDYVQIMNAISFSSGGSANRVQEIADISRALKSLALELDVPIILLSQLNRGVESRTDKRPNLSDLRESGALEQDADIVLLLYRDDYYNKEDSKAPGVAEIDISKNRSGSTGTIKLAFLHELTRFENLYINYDNSSNH